MNEFFRSRFSFRDINLIDIVVISMLISMEIVFDRFLAINTWNIKITLGFLPVALIAYRYGCIGSIIAAALADFIGAMLFPFGPYYFGFTATAAVVGLIFGIFLYKNCKIVNILLAVFLSGILCTLILNTLCITLLYGGDFTTIMISRLPQFAVTAIAEIVIFRYLYIFDTAFKKLPKIKR